MHVDTFSQQKTPERTVTEIAASTEPQSEGILVPINLHRWMYDSEYNENLHREAMDAARKAGEACGMECERRVMEFLMDVPRKPDIKEKQNDK